MRKLIKECLDWLLLDGKMGKLLKELVIMEINTIRQYMSNYV